METYTYIFGEGFDNWFKRSEQLLGDYSPRNLSHSAVRLVTEIERKKERALQESYMNASDDHASADRIVSEELRSRRVQALVEVKQSAVNSLGDDVYDAGAIISFTKRFGSKTYTYAAVKGSDKKWHTTSSREGVFTDWFALVEWLVSGEYPVSQVYVMETRSAVSK